jgi:hypothetical protein
VNTNDYPKRAINIKSIDGDEVYSTTIGASMLKGLAKVLVDEYTLLLRRVGNRLTLAKYDS